MPDKPTSTTSSSPSPQYHQIGHGMCAEVFASSTGIAFKKAHSAPIKHTEVRNDAFMHRKVCAAFKRHNPQLIHVPSYLDLIESQDDWWWEEVNSQLPGSHLPEAKSKERRPVLIMEQIPFVCEGIRETIMRMFCRPDLFQTSQRDPMNEDCLLRLYLGLRSSLEFIFSPFSTSFTLRNYPYSLEKIDLDPVEVALSNKLWFADAIAEGLAILHWGARIDARDVEFVLGSIPEQEDVGSQNHGRSTIEFKWKLKKNPKINDPTNDKPPPEVREARTRVREVSRTRDPSPSKVIVGSGSACVWVLDFNQCEEITMDEKGCIKAAKALWDNDPYFPRPFTKQDGDLWEHFMERYLHHSDIVLETESEEMRKLPKYFMVKVVEIGKARNAKESVLDGPPKYGLLDPPRDR
ncbi:zinc finger protein-domain-containing protein [Tricladium varicosporioides]|nr:zinc finger protein-domain-containing protein [Hymenoscyphus varicosporioides]